VKEALALHASGELIQLSASILRAVEDRGVFAPDVFEAREFCRRLLRVAHIVTVGAMPPGATPRPAPRTAEIVDLPMQRRLRVALATGDDGDAA
jgi:hypothetical protein